MSLNDADFERLSLFADGALPRAEAAEVARLVATDPEWRLAHRAIRASGEMLRAPVEANAQRADLEGLWGRIERRLPSRGARTPEPGWLERMRAIFSPPVLIGLAAGVAVAAYVATRPVTRAPAPGPGESTPAPGEPSGSPVAAVPGSVSPPPESIIIEGIETEGAKTVLVSQPADNSGATVIWLLDAPDGGAADPGGGPAGDDDPI